MKGNGPSSRNPSEGKLKGGPAQRKYRKTGRVMQYVHDHEAGRRRPKMVSDGVITGRTRQRIKHGWR